MSKDNKIIVLDTPEQIQAFGLLQIHGRLKLEVRTAGSGMRWRVSPMKQAQAVLRMAGIEPKGRKVAVLSQYEDYLKSVGVLKDEA